MSPPFQLQLKIGECAARYSFREDVDPLEAGKRIRERECTRENLERLFEWKTKGRGRSRLDKNSDEDIADARSLATKAKSDRAAVAVLMGLNGVQVPVASAVLTTIDPERFTVIDFRALEAQYWRECASVSGLGPRGRYERGSAHVSVAGQQR